MAGEFRTANNQWLTLAQMVDRSSMWKARYSRGRIELFHVRKKVAGLLKNLSDEKRITLLISRHNIPGVRRVLAQALRNGASSHAIVSKLERAVAGTYQAKGWTEEENDIALMVLRIGGPALLTVMKRATGLPGLTSTRTFAGKVRFLLGKSGLGWHQRNGARRSLGLGRPVSVGHPLYVS